MTTTHTRAHARTADVPSSFSGSWPCELESAVYAKRLVRDALTAWGIGQLGADAALVASELAGNAIQHAGCQSFRLSIALLAQRRIRISVSDQGGALPEMLRAPDEESERGRGLLIVAAIADRWGTEVVGPDKTVWTELSTERP